MKPLILQQLTNMNLRNFSMANRLALAFGLIVALFAGTTAFAFYKMKSLETDMRTAIRAASEVSSKAQVMREAIYETYANVLLATVVKVKDDLSFQDKEFAASVGRYEAAKRDLLSLTGNGAGIPGFKEAMAQAVEAEDLAGVMKTLLQRRVSATADAQPSDDIPVDAGLQTGAGFAMKGQLRYWVEGTDALVNVIVKESQRTADNAQQSATVARQVLLIAAGVALLVSVAAAFLIARSVTRPIRMAVSVAELVAEGDLSQAIVSESRDETGALLDALSRMQDGLHDLVSEVRQSADSIGLASSEVAMGNMDLSQRTEHAAGNLQRTASSLEQLVGSVRQSADAAQAANALVSSAASAAETGGRVMSQVVNNMQSIASQSKRIGDIIGVIDGIAFQTNILALNAAVEAARAGEQGRGFAVVAGEVRTLAQRSAEAARDIKHLIGTSVAQVDDGSKLVQDAGHAMEEIVGSVGRVAVMINEISTSSALQREGIGEVGQAMTQLDQMTQQNAALVEQSAAAADALKAQAQRLSEVVKVFTLRSGAAEPLEH